MTSCTSGRYGSLHSLSVESLYPLLPYQKAIFQDIVSCLSKRQRFLDRSADPCDSSSSDRAKYRALCGKPGTGKSQVLIRAIHHALQQESQVLVAAPVALLAQGFRSIFGSDLEAEIIHSTFHIPVNEDANEDMNFGLNKFDMVVVDEASLVSPQTFKKMASTFNRLNVRPVVVVTGDKCQQQPLQTAPNGRVSTTVSILNDATFTNENSVKHGLYQQFRIVDPEYARFVDLLRYSQPTQSQLDDFQQDIVVCQDGDLQDCEISQAFSNQPETSIMTVSRAAAQRVNTILVKKLFAGQDPLCDVPCAAVADSPDIFPYRGMRIVITENRDKASRIVNGQDATILSSHGNTLLIQFPDNQRAFIYPVTHHVDGQGDVTTFPCTPAYARTICKSQGQNLKHLVLWLDCPTVPPGLAYVALSRIRRKCDLSILQPMVVAQLLPVPL